MRTHKNRRSPLAGVLQHRQTTALAGGIRCDCEHAWNEDSHELSSGGLFTCVIVLRPVSEHCGTFTLMIRSERWLFRLAQVVNGPTGR